jgi:hypothetical protein
MTSRSYNTWSLCELTAQARIRALTLRQLETTQFINSPDVAAAYAAKEKEQKEREENKLRKEKERREMLASLSMTPLMKNMAGSMGGNVGGKGPKKGGGKKGKGKEESGSVFLECGLSLSLNAPQFHIFVTFCHISLLPVICS